MILGPSAAHQQLPPCISSCGVRVRATSRAPLAFPDLNRCGSATTSYLDCLGAGAASAVCAGFFWGGECSSGRRRMLAMVVEVNTVLPVVVARADGEVAPVLLDARVCGGVGTCAGCG
eukprot:2687180-Amphidinium_carterae.1